MGEGDEGRDHHFLFQSDWGVDVRRDCHFLFWMGKEMRGGIVISFSGGGEEMREGIIVSVGGVDKGRDHCFLFW